MLETDQQCEPSICARLEFQNLTELEILRAMQLDDGPEAAEATRLILNH